MTEKTAKKQRKRSIKNKIYKRFLSKQTIPLSKGRKAAKEYLDKGVDRLVCLPLHLRSVGEHRVVVGVQHSAQPDIVQSSVRAALHVAVVQRERFGHTIAGGEGDVRDGLHRVCVERDYVDALDFATAAEDRLDVPCGQNVRARTPSGAVVPQWRAYLWCRGGASLQRRARSAPSCRRACGGRGNDPLSPRAMPRASVRGILGRPSEKRDDGKPDYILLVFFVFYFFLVCQTRLDSSATCLHHQRALSYSM